MLDEQLVQEYDTDEWWFNYLGKKLGDRLQRVNTLQAWMDGQPPIALPDSPSAQQAFRRLSRLANQNYAETIVNSVLHRMEPVSFQTGADGDRNGDIETRRIWKSCNMQSTFATVLEWMLGLSESYVIVGTKTVKGKLVPVITAEHPAQMVVEVDPSDPTTVIAALKIYRDLAGVDIAVLFRPGYSRVAIHPGTTILPKANTVRWKINPASWTFKEPEESGIERCTVQVFTNHHGMSEFEAHIPSMERINHTVLQRMIIVAFQAFRQRGIKGVPNTDKSGNPIDYTNLFQSSPDSLWLLPATAEMWEGQQADIRPILDAIKDDRIALASASGTPVDELFPDGANQSAKGAVLKKEAIENKKDARIAIVNGYLANLLSIIYELLGDDVRADISQIEVNWKMTAPEISLEMAQAGQAAALAGVPWGMRMTKIFQFNPDEMAIAEQEHASDALLATPTPPPAAPAAQGTPSTK